MVEQSGSVPEHDAAAQRAFVAGGRRDRSSQGRRPNVVKLRLDDTELTELLGRAAAHGGLSIQRYLLECATAIEAGGPAVQTAADRQEAMATFLGVRRLLANIANNVNQVAKAANAGALPATQAEATAAIRSARRAADKLAVLVDGMIAAR